MRKTLSVAALILALSCPVYAGIMHNPAPQPTPANTMQEPAAPDTVEEPTTTDEGTAGATDILTQAALDLLAVLPSLL